MAGNIEETSYDILEWFPILFCQEVFSYLDGKDVIQASAVNKQWYKFTGERQQMKKVKLMFSQKIGMKEIDMKELTIESQEILISSKRNYQNIEFKNIKFSESKLHLGILAAKARSLKSVILFGCKFTDELEWIQILQTMEPTVEKLLPDIRFEWSRKKELNLSPQCTFPCLRTLTFGTFGKHILKYFVNCKNLEKFDWPQLMGSVGCDTAPGVRTLLRNNRNIKDIKTSNDGFLFSEPVEFKLQKFSVDGWKMRASSELCRFLESHSATLKTLEISAKLDEICLKLLLGGLPKLSSLSTDFGLFEETISNWRQDFPVNTTITNLELLNYGIDGRQQKSFDTFIRALTSLKDFKCRELNEIILLSFASTAPALESIETGCLNFPRFPEGEIFPKLRKFKVDSFHENLHGPTGKKFTASSVDEMRKFFKELTVT